MPRFIYCGDINDPNDVLEDKEAFGLLFPVGEPVEVTDEAIAAKLRGNGHWVEEGSEAASRVSGKRRGRPRKEAA